jgi:hypothetical protein
MTDFGLDASENTLLGVLDRLLDRGVVVQGDLRISVAGIDLLEVGAKVMLASIDTADRWRRGERKLADDTIVVALVAEALSSAATGRDYLAALRRQRDVDAADIDRILTIAGHLGATVPMPPLRLGTADLEIAVVLPAGRGAVFAAEVARVMPGAVIRHTGSSAGADHAH